MPAPSTTGGAMGYPSTVDSGIVAPFSLYDGDFSNAVAGSITANTCYLNAIWVPMPVTITAVRMGFSAGGNGHYDTGIYDATGTNNAPNNLLAHAAATATSLTTSTAIKSPSFINGNLSLAPGLYWLAFWCDNATDTAYRTGSGAVGLQVTQFGTNNGPLPALASSISSIANGTRHYAIEALLLNSWS